MSAGEGGTEAITSVREEDAPTVSASGGDESAAGMATGTDSRGARVSGDAAAVASSSAETASFDAVLGTAPLEERLGTLTVEDMAGGGAEDASRDPFDTDDFNAVALVNSLFPTEESLSGVEPLAARLRRKIRKVDAAILDAVRTQGASGARAKEDLVDAKEAIRELQGRVQEIRRKAEQSEAMVQEICRDIKKLDYAKKNLTTTITALRRLAMLVSAVDQLEAMASRRQYREAANLLEAVNQLMDHFEPYGNVAKLAELRGKFAAIRQLMRSAIFEDFQRLGTAAAAGGVEDEDDELTDELSIAAPPQQLADACLVVEALGSDVREELVQMVVGRELDSYRQIFGLATDGGKLETFSRRYAWIRRRVRANELTLSIFPPHWNVLSLLVSELCQLTRSHLSDMLAARHGDVEVQVLLQALQRTIEFEDELQERFGGQAAAAAAAAAAGADAGDDAFLAGLEGGGSGESAADVRAKYERQRRERAESEADEASTAATAAPPAAVVSFKGMISSCIEPHMGAYTDLETRTLLEALDTLVSKETWDGQGSSSGRVLASAEQMFLHIKKVKDRCSQLSKGQTLFRMHEGLVKVLRTYAGKLSAHLPKTAGGAAIATAGLPGATADWRVTCQEKDEQAACFIVNTCEYCQNTATALAESVHRAIDPAFKERVDMTAAVDELLAAGARALGVLVLAVETRLNDPLLAMAKLPWGTLEDVGDQSEWARQCGQTLQGIGFVAGNVLDQLHARLFCDKLAASFAPRLYAAVLRCRPVSEAGAQQMLLDVHAVKTALAKLPQSMGMGTAPASYIKLVQRDVGRTETLLKVLPSPQEQIAETFRALFPDGTPQDFADLLLMKGLKRGDAQAMADAFARASGIAPGAVGAAARYGASGAGGSASGSGGGTSGTLQKAATAASSIRRFLRSKSANKSSAM